jgi:hypothetical protein
MHIAFFIYECMFVHVDPFPIQSLVPSCHNVFLFPFAATAIMLFISCKCYNKTEGLCVNFDGIRNNDLDNKERGFYTKQASHL